MVKQYQAMEEYKPAEKFFITDLETLKVIADPLRVQLLEALTLEPLTVKELAERLGLSASKLYYHITQLEKYDFIQVVATRLVANMLEKQYRATAEKLEVDKSLLAFRSDSGKENLTSLAAVTLDATRDDILRSLQARHFDLEMGAQDQPRHLTLIRDVNHLDESRAQEFHARLHALMEEFKTTAEPAATTGEKPQLYAMLLALYPTFYFREEENHPQEPT